MIKHFLTAVAMVVTALNSTLVLAQTMTVTDVLDREVEIIAEPQRILLGFYFEDFFAVGGPGAYDRVVAISRDAWESWRNFQWQAYTRAVPRIAEIVDVGEVDAGTFSLELAIDTRPDVAVLAAWQYGALGEAVGRLEEAGIPVVVLDYNAQEVEKHVASTLALGAVLGTHQRAQALAELYADAVAGVEARVAGVDERPKVYLELGRKGAGEVDLSWGDVMWGRLAETAGGVNIAKEHVVRWAPLSPEHVLSQNPKVIFLPGSGWVGQDEAVSMGPGIDASTAHARMEPYLARPGWSGLDAVKARQVHALYHGGARSLYDFVFLQYIAKTLHPELFEDVDPQANLEAFFRDYMPIPLSGTYMTKLP